MASPSCSILATAYTLHPALVLAWQYISSHCSDAGNVPVKEFTNTSVSFCRVDGLRSGIGSMEELAMCYIAIHRISNPVNTYIICSLVPRPPQFFVLPCIILNTNQRTKNGGGLGTMLHHMYLNPHSSKYDWLHLNKLSSPLYQLKKLLKWIAIQVNVQCPNTMVQ